MKFRWSVWALLCFAIVQMVAAQESYVRPRLITVSGTAEVKVPPDEAILDLGVETHDKQLAVAKSTHDESVKKLLAVARDNGIEAKYIQTGRMVMRPEYSQKKFIGYQVSQDLSLTLKDISKYETLMTRLLEAGVNHVNGVEFDVAEPRKYRDETRLKAIRAAREKAEAMAAELGQKIGKPWEITDESSANYLSYGVVA